MVVDTSPLVVVDTSAVVVNDEVMLEMCPASFELCKRLSSQVEATSVAVALGLLEAAIDTVVGVGKTKDESLCPSPCPPGPADVPALSSGIEP